MVGAVRESDGQVTVWKRAGLIDNLARFQMKVEEGRNVSPWGYTATTALSSLNRGIGSIDSVLPVAGVHKIKPCSEGTYSQAVTIVSWTTPGNCVSYWKEA